MKFFPLVMIVAFASLVLAVGYGYEYWIKLRGRSSETIQMVLPNGDKKDVQIFKGAIPDSKIDLKDVMFPNILSETKFQVLVAMLDSSKTVNGRGVGICGVYTWQYACYERLKKIAKPKELVYLTRHRNPVIRVYAYKALANVDSAQARIVRERLLHDTETFVDFSGCTMMTEQVKDFVSYDQRD